VKLSCIVQPADDHARQVREIAAWLWLFHCGYAALWAEGFIPILRPQAPPQEED